MWYKRLEKGVFHWPRAHATPLEVHAADLTLLRDGIDLAHATRKARVTPGLVKTAGG